MTLNSFHCLFLLLSSFFTSFLLCSHPSFLLGSLHAFHSTSQLFIVSWSRHIHRNQKKVIITLSSCIYVDAMQHVRLGVKVIVMLGVVCMLSAYNLQTRQCSAEALVVCWTHIVPLISLKSEPAFYVCLAV